MDPVIAAKHHQDCNFCVQKFRCCISKNYRSVQLVILAEDFERFTTEPKMILSYWNLLPALTEQGTTQALLQNGFLLSFCVLALLDSIECNLIQVLYHFLVHCLPMPSFNSACNKDDFFIERGQCEDNCDSLTWSRQPCSPTCSDYHFLCHWCYE